MLDFKNDLFAFVTSVDPSMSLECFFDELIRLRLIRKRSVFPILCNYRVLLLRRHGLSLEQCFDRVSDLYNLSYSCVESYWKRYPKPLLP